jgi:hypothetical protein
VPRRVAAAFLQRLTHIGQKMRAMLGEVRAKAAAMLREHKKAGALFTIAPASAQRNVGARHDIPGSARPQTWSEGRQAAVEPMTAAMMALSLLSNTNYLIDQGLHSLALPRLPLMYPDDRPAQDRCMARVDGVRAVRAPAPAQCAGRAALRASRVMLLHCANMHVCFRPAAWQVQHAGVACVPSLPFRRLQELCTFARICK